MELSEIAAATDQVHTHREARELPCPLTPDEVRLRGIDLANAAALRAAIEAEKKAAAKDFGERIKAVEEQITTLSDVVRRGSELREIGCEKRVNYYTGLLTVERLDTGETVERRYLRPDEMQMELRFPDDTRERDDR